MEFKFAQYTEITDFVFNLRPELKEEGYQRFFICPDVWDYWFVRILKGFEINEKEGYLVNDDNYILERERVAMDKKGETLTHRKLREIIRDDEGGSYDIQQGEDIDELIDMLDDGFGIINLKTN